MAARKSRSEAKAARPTTVAAYLASLTPDVATVIAMSTPEEYIAYYRRVKGLA